VDRADDGDIGSAGLVAGSVDAYLAGPGDPRFHRVIIGVPGIGKTAALREIGKEAASRLGWAVALHHCRPKERVLGPLVDEVGLSVAQAWPAEARRFAREVPAFSQASMRTATPAERSVLTDLALASCEVEPGAGPTWCALKNFLRLVGLLAKSLSRGLVVMLDDADRLGGAEVEALGHLAKSLSRDEVPVALALSGGPQLGARFARAGHFSRRVWASSLSSFDDDEAREALLIPAADRGVEIEEGALALLCAMAAGLPLEIQRLGFAAWSTRDRPETITPADVEAALAATSSPPAERAS
jgi:hypothetical protein